MQAAVLSAAHEHARSAKAEYRVVIRARIVRNAAAGISNEENARRNGVHPDTVRKTRRRAAAAKSAREAFVDAPRSGRPARIAMETRAALIQLACARPTPELERKRVKARLADGRAAKRAAQKALRRARAEQRRAARRQRSAERQAKRDDARRARKARNAAARAEKRASKASAKADARIAAAQADTARVMKKTPEPFSAVWTLKTLQAALVANTGETMSLSEIRRILQCGGLRPHRVRMWLHSPDPDFHAKVRAICELYVNPPAGAVVLCVDEKSGMQARADLHPIHVSNGAVRREFEYTRNGTSTLIAAFNIRSGEVFGRCWRRNAKGIVRFLEALAKKHPTGDVYIVWDNLNVHSGPAIEEFNKRHGGRFHFVYTPKHASWMNQVEVWFSILQRRILKYGSFSSKRELEAAVMSFVVHWNEIERRPFRWRFRGEFAPRIPCAA